VERIGVELSRRSVESADLILYVIDLSEGITDEDVEMLHKLKDGAVILVLNKVDLIPEEARDLVVEGFVGTLGRSLPAIRTCASSGQGIDRLEREIASLAEVAEGVGSVMVSNVRHRRLLQEAGECLDHAISTVDAAEPIDLLSVDLIAARNSLGMITGETASEDLLDRIFSEFCIGK